MTDNPNGTVSLTDVTEYTQEGDKFSAGILNELSQNANWPLTHSKSGTTHYLTGLSGVSGTVSCVFKATAAFNAGDSIRVDNTGYTIQLSNGEAAEDNLFVSGASVPVVIDTAGKKVNFKAAGGVKLPALDWVIYRIYVVNGTFVVPITGTYRITCIGQGGDGASGSGYNPYRGGGGGASGGGCELVTKLTKGQSYPITVGTTSSFGSLLSAIRGRNASGATGGTGGTSSGGTPLTPQNGETAKSDTVPNSKSGGRGGTVQSRVVPEGLANGGARALAGANGKTTESLKASNQFYPFGTGGGGGAWYNSGSGNTISGSGAAGNSGAVIVELVLN